MSQRTLKADTPPALDLWQSFATSTIARTFTLIGEAGTLIAEVYRRRAKSLRVSSRCSCRPRGWLAPRCSCSRRLRLLSSLPAVQSYLQTLKAAKEAGTLEVTRVGSAVLEAETIETKRPVEGDVQNAAVIS